MRENENRVGVGVVVGGIEKKMGKMISKGGMEIGRGNSSWQAVH